MRNVGREEYNLCRQFIKAACGTQRALREQLEKYGNPRKSSSDEFIRNAGSDYCIVDDPCSNEPVAYRDIIRGSIARKSKRVKKFLGHFIPDDFHLPPEIKMILRPSAALLLETAALYIVKGRILPAYIHLSDIGDLFFLIVFNF